MQLSESREAGPALLCQGGNEDLPIPCSETDKINAILRSIIGTQTTQLDKLQQGNTNGGLEKIILESLTEIEDNFHVIRESILTAKDKKTISLGKNGDKIFLELKLSKLIKKFESICNDRIVIMSKHYNIPKEIIELMFDHGNIREGLNENINKMRVIIADISNMRELLEVIMKSELKEV